MQEKPWRTRVAALQMGARVADLAYNVEQAFVLLDEAISKGVRIIALPEFFTTQIVYDERLFACSLPAENRVLSGLRERARRHDVTIGGSYLEIRDGDVGAAVCWKMIRARTVRRLRGRVDLLMTGSHWWGEPGWRWLGRLRLKTERYNRDLMYETPRTLDRESLGTKAAGLGAA